MMKYFLGIILCFAIIGCNKPGRVEFVQVIQNHRELSVETIDALVASLEDELAELQAEGITPSDEAAAHDLMERLWVIQEQSRVIEQYVNTNIVDEDLLAKLLMVQWRRE